MFRSILSAALLSLMALPAQAAEISGVLGIGGTAEMQIQGAIGIGTVEFLDATVRFLPFSFPDPEPVLTWQNMGQTIPLADIGTNSDLACATDCLFTLGAAEFHVLSRGQVQGDLTRQFLLHQGRGTLIIPGFDPAIGNFLFSIVSSPSAPRF